MPVSPTYPGVYVQEVPSGVRTIVGVSTSTALFIGSCKDGPINTPVLCTTYSDFARSFSEDSASSDLPRYVKLFYLNGGSTCYVMRIADGAGQATVKLDTEASTVGVQAPALLLTATNAGAVGNNLRVAVTYDTDQPEATFNLEIFRWDTDAGGNPVKAASELWRNLSMNPASASYAASFITQNSALVTATDIGTKTAGPGFSRAGRPVLYGASFAAAWGGIITAGANQFQISVGGSRYVTVDLAALRTAAPVDEAAFLVLLNAALAAAVAPLPGAPTIKASFVSAPPAVPNVADTTKWLDIRSTNADVFIRPSPTNDIAVALMLGTAQGGYEVGAFAALRPAPTGISIPPSSIVGVGANQFAAQEPPKLTGMSFDGGVSFVTFGANGLATTPNNTAVYFDASVASVNGNRDGVREKLRLIAQYVASYAAGAPSFPWVARVWGYRLNFARRDGADNAVGTLSFTGWTGFSATSYLQNLRYYSLGAAATTAFQGAGVPGSDGSAPLPSDYAAAYPIVDREVDLFNILVLPSASNVNQTQLWGAASVFCQQRRAILLMDAPTSWSNAQTAKAGVDTLRIGLVKDHAALYYPRLTINENELPVQLGPTGAIAGLMARIDGTRGVWKAPAGTEADIRGVSGLEKRFSDLENGILNPKAINTLRVFPSGVVCWGARTMDGDDANPSDFKYVPIRRLSLYIEESLYRGLKWVVFEPNDEPLWAQVRLNVGAFMHGLFTRGAFQGKKSSDAYFVRCDVETTTQDDRNKGIVNIWVGFAPLKPAEFVVLYLQQMAGQIAV